MPALMERVWFHAATRMGRLLRSATYSRVRVVRMDGGLQVRKQRRFYAPLLVAMGNPLVRILDTGVRVLPQRDWEQREREMYLRLYGSSVDVDGDGGLVLPHLPGVTLAALLDDPRLDEMVRTRAIGLAVEALAGFHRRGLTHGDAMAENVMVNLEDGTARWFDFETVHDARRPMAWRRADDVRSLVATCLLRTAPVKVADTLDHILNAYADEEVTRLLAAGFTVFRRSLPFHLGQAGLSCSNFQAIGRVLTERSLIDDSGRTR